MGLLSTSPRCDDVTAARWHCKRRAFWHAGDTERVQDLQPLTAEADLDVLAARILIHCQHASAQQTDTEAATGSAAHAVAA